MTAVTILIERQRAAQWRTLLDTLALGVPAALIAGALAGRMSGVLRFWRSSRWRSCLRSAGSASDARDGSTRIG